MRVGHELPYHDDVSSFVTCTYSDESMPLNGSLVKRDGQLFMKRLRKRFPDAGIMYLGCGEYGSENQRPHFHYILTASIFLRIVSFRRCLATVSCIRRSRWIVRGRSKASVGLVMLLPHRSVM